MHDLVQSYPQPILVTEKQTKLISNKRGKNKFFIKKNKKNTSLSFGMIWWISLPRENQKRKKRGLVIVIREIYEHCGGGLPSETVDTEHGTGIGVELMNELWLVLKHLVVLPHEVCSYLRRYLKHSDFIHKTKNLKRDRDREGNLSCGDGNGKGCGHWRKNPLNPNLIETSTDPQCKCAFKIYTAENEWDLTREKRV